MLLEFIATSLSEHHQQRLQGTHAAFTCDGLRTVARCCRGCNRRSRIRVDGQRAAPPTATGIGANSRSADVNDGRPEPMRSLPRTRLDPSATSCADGPRLEHDEYSSNAVALVQRSGQLTGCAA